MRVGLIFFFAFFASVSCSAQRFVLIDTKMKLPILYTDSLTADQADKGYFPVQLSAMDSLVANLNYLKELLSLRARAKMESFELHAASTIIKTERVPAAYGDRYNIMARTTVGELQTYMRLTTAENSNSKNRERIERLLSYLKKEKQLFREPKEIVPKVYNVQIISG
ncbi:hypothetical protein [Pseudocnuella soli]|uniref:hypothetical protein n=1 Tax=Pseudocnuella soli TaxID=2502779 RepID=UPI0010525C0F|nr:hypothetical protein [Pseudocnuella soli]